MSSACSLQLSHFCESSATVKEILPPFPSPHFSPLFESPSTSSEDVLIGCKNGNTSTSLQLPQLNTWSLLSHSLPWFKQESKLTDSQLSDSQPSHSFCSRHSSDLSAISLAVLVSFGNCFLKHWLSICKRTNPRNDAWDADTQNVMRRHPER